MRGRRCKTDKALKASESYTNSPPNLTSTPKNEEIVLGTEQVEGEAELRRCGNSGGVGGERSVVTANVSPKLRLPAIGRVFSVEDEV